MKKYIVTLTKDEREALGVLTSRGKHKSQKILNALILLGCDESEFQKKRLTNKEIARVLNGMGDVVSYLRYFQLYNPAPWVTSVMGNAANY